MKILFEKRHCVIHRNSRVSPELRNLLNQMVAMNAKVPLDGEEIVSIMEIIREFVLNVENQYPSPVDWERKGLTIDIKESPSDMERISSLYKTFLRCAIA